MKDLRINCLILVSQMDINATYEGIDIVDQLITHYDINLYDHDYPNMTDERYEEVLELFRRKAEGKNPKDFIDAIIELRFHQQHQLMTRADRLMNIHDHHELVLTKSKSIHSDIWDQDEWCFEDGLPTPVSHYVDINSAPYDVRMAVLEGSHSSNVDVEKSAKTVTVYRGVSKSAIEGQKLMRENGAYLFEMSWTVREQVANNFGTRFAEEDGFVATMELPTHLINYVTGDVRGEAEVIVQVDNPEAQALICEAWGDTTPAIFKH